MEGMAAFNRKSRATHMVFALAAALCAVIIAVTLLLSSTKIHNIAPRITSKDGSQLRIQQHHLIGAYTTTQDESYPLNKIKTRRHLSSDLQCPTLNRPEPQLPPIVLTGIVPGLLKKSTYAASFPGLGANKLITKHLVESITGMLVGEASISPSLERMKAQHMDRTGFARGQGEVIVVQTHFPYSSGTLAAYDDCVPRAFVILRNPLHAISCYFDQLYQTRSHVPAGSSANSKETHDAWIKWRDDQFSEQVLLYGKFVSFWMEKYLGNDDNRMYFAYEDLIDEEIGAQEAIRLAGFLEGSIRASAMEMTESQFAPELIAEEALKSFAGSTEVPCVWKDIIHATISNGKTTASTEQIPEEANKFSFRGGDWSATERPFTAENLAEISSLLSELINRWSLHKRVLSILSGYHQEVLNIGGIQSTGQLIGGGIE